MSLLAAMGLAGCIDAIESAYEFMPAYAAQGVAGAAAGSAGSEIRATLERAERAMGELPLLLNEAIQIRNPPALEP